LVQRIVLHDGWAEVQVGDHRVRAKRVVLCTNGFVDHVVENRAGPPISFEAQRSVRRTIGFMVGAVEETLRPTSALSYIRNEHIGDDLIPYVYVTARHFERDGVPVSLVCAGGPEVEFEPGYDADGPLASDIAAQFDADVRPLAFPERAPGDAYDFAWHGVMGYTPSQVRLVGIEPNNPVLLYNLGCNGVGFLPSIAGGLRIARLIRGDQLPRSIFDPATMA